MPGREAAPMPKPPAPTVRFSTGKPDQSRVAMTSTGQGRLSANMQARTERIVVTTIAIQCGAAGDIDVRSVVGLCRGATIMQQTSIQDKRQGIHIKHIVIPERIGDIKASANANKES